MANYTYNINHSGLTIYNVVAESNSNLYIPTQILESILNDKLVGLSLEGLALRTRSKVVKSAICEALGYPIPSSFRKIQPRFPCQNFDVYTQKSMNVQIWNEEVDEKRRYVFLQCSENDIVLKVRVITGKELATYDNTGTLTKKYQATMYSRGQSRLFSINDTKNLKDWLQSTNEDLRFVNPNSVPKPNQTLPISTLYEKLITLEGKTIDYIDAVQERNRGAELHSLICKAIGYSVFQDDGTYPDILNQLLEIKLQTSPTIDLGKHSPKDGAVIFDLPGKSFRSEDIRYAIIDASVNSNKIKLNYIYLVNGKDFTSHFPLFGGKVQNAKLQLLLPSNFFD